MFKLIQGKVNLLLALSLIALLFIALKYNGETPSDNNDKITSLSPQAITSITVIQTNKSNIQFIKHNETWFQIDAKNKTPASNEKLDLLLSLPKAISLESFPINQEKLAQYRLLQPKLTIRYNNALTIAFGSSEPLKHRRYILIKQQVHLITDLHYPLILKSLNPMQLNESDPKAPRER